MRAGLGIDIELDHAIGRGLHALGHGAHNRERPASGLHPFRVILLRLQRRDRRHIEPSRGIGNRRGRLQSRSSTRGLRLVAKHRAGLFSSVDASASGRPFFLLACKLYSVFY